MTSYNPAMPSPARSTSDHRNHSVSLWALYPATDAERLIDTADEVAELIAAAPHWGDLEIRNRWGVVLARVNGVWGAPG